MTDVTSVSLVIRAWNEAEPLRRLLKSIAEQDFEGNIELVVVDNGSTDDTAEVAKAAGAKVVHLPQKDFSYPKSLNLGLAAASNEVVVEVVAHALPIGRDWLRSGVSHLADDKVAGVYSPVKAFPKASLAEKTLYNPGYEWAKQQGIVVIKATGIGVFGATNIVMRRSLWERHPFDEAYGAGGEDGEWVGWAMATGYKIICDPGFAVYHSHGVSEIGMAKQMAYWMKLGGLKPFEQAALRRFRKDLKFDDKDEV